jgi:hypothetical protein
MRSACVFDFSGLLAAQSNESAAPHLAGRGTVVVEGDGVASGEVSA